jgi:hypothetical protein
MSQIQFTPDLGPMGGTLTGVPLFPGDAFRVMFPEAIGDGANVCWFPKYAWTQLPSGAWRCNGIVQREVSYVLTLTPGFDTVDVHITATNISDRDWATSMAFNCFNASLAPSTSDFECARHWTSDGTGFKRLVQLPRTWSVRPTVQAYSVLGSQPANAVPFVDGFKATSTAVAENWLAIQSRDGSRLIAVATKPALFLFQNMEYSCIHSAGSFGPLAQGASGSCWTRIYLVQDSLAAWYARKKFEMGD